MGSVVTMQDATPARLRALGVGDRNSNLIALEFSIDFRAKPGPSSCRDALHERVFGALLRRLSPWLGEHLGTAVGHAKDEYLPLVRNEVTEFDTQHGRGFKIYGPGSRVQYGRRALKRHGLRVGTVYFGKDNRAATSQPGSRAAAQVKLYFKTTDRAKRPIPHAQHRVRVEVTLNAKAIASLLGPDLTVSDLPSLNYRRLVQEYMVLTVPVPSRKAIYKIAAKPPALAQLLTTRIRSLALKDTGDALITANFFGAQHRAINFKVMPGATDVLREAADGLRAKLSPLKKDWDLT